MTTPLPRSFFSRPTLTVAQDLLGKEFIFGNFSGYITETEAYVGQGDPACHAARGRTKRTEVMFGPPGYSYVYFIYGMYHCLNFVTEPEGSAAAVLIRGLQLIKPKPILLDGPGKLCRELGITREHNALDLLGNNQMCIRDSQRKPDFKTTERIGITKGTEKPWRFVVEGKLET